MVRKTHPTAAEKFCSGSQVALGTPFIGKAVLCAKFEQNVGRESEAHPAFEGSVGCVSRTILNTGRQKMVRKTHPTATATLQLWSEDAFHPLLRVKLF
jgi:hypothetical protein